MSKFNKISKHDDDTTISKNEVAKAAPVEEAKAEEQDSIPIPGIGLTQEQIDELKKKYKKIYRSSYIGDTYIWHRINRSDFSAVYEETNKIEDQDELIRARERRICNAVIVWPTGKQLEQQLDNDVITSKFAEEILFRSGFFGPKTEEL